MTHPRHARSRRGFSLLEVLCALLVAATGLAALSALSRTASRQDATAELVGALEGHLRAHLDVLCHRPFPELAAAARRPGGALALPLPALAAGLRPLVIAEAARVALVEDGLARVSVTAHWTMPGDARARARLVAVERLVAQADLSLEASHASSGW